MFSTINPATQEEKQYQYYSQDETLVIARKAKEDFGQWQQKSYEERVKHFSKLAGILRNQKKEFATLMTQEMGKPITESLGEVEKCAWLLDTLVEKGASWLADEEVVADGKKHFIHYEPLGVIYLIMPWNFPFWQVFKVGMPHLMAGNTIVLKHAANVTASAKAIEKACKEAGVPLHLVIIDHETSDLLIDSDLIAGVSVTGSVAAGSAVAARAGKNIKKTVLELGGSDPLIVLEDADIEKAAQGAVLGRCGNTGQICIGAKRMIIQESIAEEFTNLFAKKMSELVIGDPLDEKTQVGPLVNEKAVKEMEAFVQDAISKGAKVLVGGKKRSPGFYFEPTILTNITKDMDVYRKEVFGPIAPIIVVQDEKEAIAVANDTEFGLNASIWSKDLEKAQNIAKQIVTGGVFINHISASHPLLPLGGVKHSGYGRELSHIGIKEFTNAKAINIYEG